MKGPNMPIYDGVIRHTTDTLCYIEYVCVILYVISAINGINLYYLG